MGGKEIAKGVKGAFIDLATLPADKQLVKDASAVVGMYFLNQKDPITKDYISEETKDAALQVVKIFSLVVAEKTVRISVNKVIENVKEAAGKIKDNIDGTLKEATRRATPSSY